MWRDKSGDRPLSKEGRVSFAYHVSPAANRDSIRRHGLDWNRMGVAPGLASGVTVPEEPAVYLARSLGEAYFFAGMPRGRDPVDIWSVRAEGLELNINVEGLIYCPAAISPDRLNLAEADLDPVEVRCREGQ